MGLIMNEELVVRLYQDAYNEIMIPFLTSKNGSSMLKYETTDMVEGKVRLKFAELIVKECANVIHTKIGPKTALDVLNHFEVE